MDSTPFGTLTREFLIRENAGDRAYVEARLATHLSMRRSKGGLIDRERIGKLSGLHRRVLQLSPA
jgi:hypothetical protein